MGIGRPTDYSEDITIEICTRLATGVPLVKICRDENMPHVSTVYRWLAGNVEFRTLYECARDDQADTLADEIIDIADELPATVTEAGKNGEAVTRIDNAAVQHQRLRVEARKWIASKLKPKKYGDKIAAEITGANGKDFSEPLPMFEFARRFAFILQLTARHDEEQRIAGLLPAPVNLETGEEG